jgi:hypothetical protein
MNKAVYFFIIVVYGSFAHCCWGHGLEIKLKQNKQPMNSLTSLFKRPKHNLNTTGKSATKQVYKQDFESPTPEKTRSNKPNTADIN